VDTSRGNVGYDPLQYVTSYQEINFLAESVVNADPRKLLSHADPYWTQAATSVLCAEIAYTLMKKGPYATFTDVLDLHGRLRITEDMLSGIETTVDEEFRALEETDPDCYAIKCWKSLVQLPYRTAGCVFSELNVTLDTLFSEELRRVMSHPRKIDLEHIGQEKTVLFVTTSPVNPSLNCFINMFYGQVFKQLFEFAEVQPNGILPVPVHVLCDDFATGCPINGFAQYISIFREKGISVTLLLQSESQLASMYSNEDATTIINNCDTSLFMGCPNDLMTAKHISIRLDLPLGDVLSFPIGKEIVFRRGQRPIITDRYDIQKDEVYQITLREYRASHYKPQHIKRCDSMSPSVHQRHKSFVEEMRENMDEVTFETHSEQDLYDYFSVNKEDLQGLREFAAKGSPTEETSLDEDLQDEVEKRFQELFGSGKRKHD